MGMALALLAVGRHWPGWSAVASVQSMVAITSAGRGLARSLRPEPYDWPVWVYRAAGAARRVGQTTANRRS